MENVKNGTCKTIGDLKSCTKAGTGCGGCMPIVQSIFNKVMNEIGQEVSNHCKCAVQVFTLARLIDMMQYARIFYTVAQISTLLSQSSV